MSWAEIQKAVNSNINVPLNVLHYIEDMKTFGTKGYAWNNLETFLAVAYSPLVGYDEELIELPFLHKVLELNLHLGKHLKLLIKSNDPVFDTLETMHDVANDVSAMIEITNSETGMNTITSNITAISAIVNSETAMNAISSNETALYIFNSSANSAFSLFNKGNQCTSITGGWNTTLSGISKGDVGVVTTTNAKIIFPEIRVLNQETKWDGIRSKSIGTTNLIPVNLCSKIELTYGTNKSGFGGDSYIVFSDGYTADTSILIPHTDRTIQTTIINLTPFNTPKRMFIHTIGNSSGYVGIAISDLSLYRKV